jgi:hypothetical protein
MKFTDLQFIQHPDLPYEEAIQAVHIFPNSYGVKVCSFPGSYGFVEGLYEVSVIKGTLGNYQTCYDTPITDEILGHRDEIDVENIMSEVEELPYYPEYKQSKK